MSRPRSRRRARTVLRLVARAAVLLVILAPVGVALATADHSPVPVSEPELRTQPPSIVWSDRIFLNRPIAVGWLGARGVVYRTWAQRHPVAAERLAQPPQSAVLAYGP